MSYQVPELLAPAGSLEKLKIAVLYGADAVYLAGQNFGLRTAADNFTYNELKIGVEFAHEHGCKVYVALNSFFHDEDLEELPNFLNYLETIEVDALIVSDLGDVKTGKNYLYQAAAFDCELWRINPVFNFIMQKKVKKNGLDLIDFDQMVNNFYGKNVLFLDNEYPQDIYYQALAKELTYKIKYIFEL